MQGRRRMMVLILQLLAPFFCGWHRFLWLAPWSDLRSQGYPASEAVSRMTVADGLMVQLVASEPLVRQPVTMEFDDRGRMWVIQYLQYPNPNGLKRVQVDRYSRTKYDRVPEPPQGPPRRRSHQHSYRHGWRWSDGYLQGFYRWPESSLGNGLWPWWRVRFECSLSAFLSR